MSEIMLYPGYLVQWQGKHRYLKYEPANPEADWCIAVRTRQLQHGQSRDNSSLVRRLDDGRWEQLYSAHSYRGETHSVVYDGPYSYADLDSAKLVLQEARYSMARWLQQLLENRPIPAREPTGAITPPPGRQCCKCEELAVVTLSAYNNGYTTANIIRSFCAGCLKTGEATTASRICHLCRERKAELTIHTASHSRKDSIYEFRVHRECAENYQRHLVPRLSLQERRPLRHAVVVPG